MKTQPNGLQALMPASRPHCFNQKNKPENGSSASILVPIDEDPTKSGALVPFTRKYLRKPGATDEEVSLGMAEWAMQVSDDFFLLTYGETDSTVQVDRLFLRETGRAVVPPLRSAIAELNAKIESLAVGVDNDSDANALIDPITEFG
jgi:hypothetical protein